MLPPVVADEPPAPVVALAPAPVLLAAPAPIDDDAPPVPPFIVPGPALPGVGSAAPICPAAVPGPARPALSVSAGEPVAAYAPATATDMQPATNANVSFLISDLPKKLMPRLHDE